MKRIKKLVDEIKDELCSAKDYAECYVSFKAKNNNTWATRYKEMANDELKHANYLHERVVHDIEELSSVFKPPQAMMEKWEKEHAEYVEQAAWIKQMLYM